jgi:serine/threonine protein kinase
LGLFNGAVVEGFRGKYTILTLIGGGGLGRVWKARSNNGTTVAVKEPLTDTNDQDRIRINFEKLRVEAIVLEKLTGETPLLLSKQHEAYSLDPRIRSHIVQFIDVDRGSLKSNGQVLPNALIMEYIAGETAQDTFRQTHDLSKVEGYWEETLRIVNSLHENNILHRDISTQNLMLSNAQRDPVLIDFGTAKEGFNQLLYSDMSIVMHPGYSAPELSTGQAFPSSDLYSVAATALFMYTSTNPMSLLNSAQELDIVRRVQLQKVPPDRLDVIKKAMSFNPHDRYQTADDMLDALHKKIIEPLPAHLIVSGRKYVIKDEMIIGRLHPPCGGECHRKGFWSPPDIALNDPGLYVSKHHAKIRMTPDGECVIKEILPAAPSGTAIKHPQSMAFERLQPGKEYKLVDGDVVSLAYSPIKGAYMTMLFRER